MVSTIKHPGVTATLTEEPTNVSSDAQVQLNSSYRNYTFIAIRFSSASNNPSSFRGNLVVPVYLLSTGAFYPLAVGTTTGYVRISNVSGDDTKIRVVNTDFVSLYVIGVYGCS